MRQIEPAMIKFLDERLKDNGLAQQAIETKDARALMIEAAKVSVGIREKTNRNDGPMVELIQETIGGHSREAWCMAFVMTCIAYAEIKTGKKSWLHSSEHCLTVWGKSPPESRVKKHPLPGAVIIWQHGKSSAGHTGILLGCDEQIFQAVEGNTTSGKDDPDAEVVREGGGVYYTTRKRRGNGTMRVVGFLIPFDKNEYEPVSYDYEKNYREAKVLGTRWSSVEAVAKKILANRAEYDDVAKFAGCPWYLVGAIHFMEASLRMNGHLHNGDPLTARTVHVPEGRPLGSNPPFTWRYSAVDALKGKGAHRIKDWSIAACLEFCEKYNGLGYKTRGLMSHYLWSSTTLATKGRYVADGVFDPDAESTRPGVVSILKALGI